MSILDGLTGFSIVRNSPLADARVEILCISPTREGQHWRPISAPYGDVKCVATMAEAKAWVEAFARAGEQVRILINA